MLIYLWVNDELSIDKFHDKDNRLYQVMDNRPTGTVEDTAGPLADALAKEMPEVEYAVSVDPPTWRGFDNPGFPFDYKFLDEDYKAQYASEQRVSTLSKYFAGLAILISCLGLFGLAAFTAQRRQKEIGVRKILRATEFNIVRLLSADFTKIVLIAIIIAIPASYFITSKWLESFAYRIDLQWWFFIAAGAAAIFIAWLTIGLQTIKAASINPAETLKNE